MVEYQIDNIAVPARVGQSEVRGEIGGRMEKFFNCRVRFAEARETVYREAESAFLNPADDASGVVGLWQGEFWGKWMISAVGVCEYFQDADLREFIRTGAMRLLELQREDGYIGSYRDPLNVLPADTVASQALMGWPCNWNWNIWCRKYTLWGLLEAYRLLEDERILTGAARFADQLIDMLHSHGIDIAATGTFCGLPSCSILKPMLMLYRYTAERRYLDFALEIAAVWERPGAPCPGLIGNALSGRPLAEWYDDPKWAKAYEMMSCLEGLLELYRVTGEPRYFNAVDGIRELLRNFEYNELFSVGFNDQFYGCAGNLNAITEPCDVIHWMRLNYELFLLTGELKYMDDFEAAFYNAFLAGVYRDGSWGARGVRSSGRHFTVHEQAGFRYNHCCVNNMPRGFINMVQAAVMGESGGIRVNLYIDGSYQVPVGDGTACVDISGDYLGSGEVLLQVAAPRGLQLRLRIPGRCAGVEVACRGIVRRAAGGTWCEVELPAGPQTLRLRFEHQVEIRCVSAPAAFPDQEAVAVSRWCCRFSKTGSLPVDRMQTGEKYLLVRGPLLLARSKFIGSTEDEMFHSGSLAGRADRCQLEEVSPFTDSLAEFEAEFSSGEQARLRTRVCDFASAGNADLADCNFFSIFF